MNKKNKFLSYLENKHFDQIYKCLLPYIIKNHRSLIIERQKIINSIDFDLEDIGLKSFTIDAVENCDILIFININP